MGKYYMEYFDEDDDNYAIGRNSYSKKETVIKEGCEYLSGKSDGRIEIMGGGLIEPAMIIRKAKKTKTMPNRAFILETPRHFMTPNGLGVIYDEIPLDKSGRAIKHKAQNKE